MIEYLRDLYWDFYAWFDYLTTHFCAFKMCGMIVYGGEDRGTKGLPLVGFKYHCKCGREMIELTESGINLIANGVEYEALVAKENIWCDTSD